MKIISTGYTNTSAFDNPEIWLEHISFYTGILEELSLDHEVESIEQINFSGETVRNNVRYHFLNYGPVTSHFSFKVNKYIKDLKPDVVLINGFIFPIQVIQLKLLVGKSCRLYIFHRAEKPFAGLKKYLQSFADQYIDGYFFSSLEFGTEWINKGIIKNENKIYEVIQASSSFQPLDKKIVRSLLSIEGSPVFLWVGRLNTNKDPITVIKAFLQFLKVNPSAHLYMIYQDDEFLNEVKELIGNSDNIHLIGKVEHKNLEYWYSSADFIISGSHYEGSGIAISEAMSCGCIPIVTNIISFRSMTGRGSCGLLYEPGNTNDLLKTLNRACKINIIEERVRVISQFKKELSFHSIKEKINAILTR